MKPMQLFNTEKNHFFKKLDREFNFKDFPRFILIRISIEVQLIDWCYNKFAKINIFELRGIFLEVFFLKVAHLGTK